MNRRDFIGSAAGVAASLAPPVWKAPEPARTKAPSTKNILNYNPNMEYRRLGKTNLMVSAVCLGGHWKRVGTVLPAGFKGEGYSKQDYVNVSNPDFLKNRHDVVSRCIEVGINYVDACAGPEILAYSKVLKGRRDRMYLGFSWHERESRFKDYQASRQLLDGLDQGLREAALDYVDVWRISLPMDMIQNLGELQRVEEGAVEALGKAKQQGKVRFTGVSTHNRVWLNSLIESYPEQIEVVLFPYTASTRQLPTDSVFDAIQKHGVGVFGIKPFADNSLFEGDSSPSSPHREEDDRRARMALRYILDNASITAPIPGLANIHQVDNAAKAVMQRRKLDRKERTEMERITARMWTRLRPGYEWLRDWQYV